MRIQPNFDWASTGLRLGKLMNMNRVDCSWTVLITLILLSVTAQAKPRPHVILVMADDQGWGQTSYYGHPILKTPNLDDMAVNGLRLDRFYAAGPVCSPTRASVLTGRTHNRTGVLQHGYALHRQEKTLAAAMKGAGYRTAHFGKWHLNGIRGPGVPIFKSDAHHPGHFGFEEWLSVTNFFDMNPLMSRMGALESFQGDSSEVIVDEALKYLKTNVKADEEQPCFLVIWFGSPHSPWLAFDADKPPNESSKSAHHHGEIVAMDRSIGTLRKGLKELGIRDNTLLWYCSDNGGLKGVGHDSVGGLRGNKGSVWEGGIRVPGIIEWPAKIKPRVTSYPASTMDIFPTLVDLLELPSDSINDLVDGISIKDLFDRELGPRKKPIPFHYQNKAALVDNQWKVVTQQVGGKYELFNIVDDKKETNDVSGNYPERAQQMRSSLETILQSIQNSQQGADYPEKKVTREGPHGRFWYAIPEYKPYLKEWAKRPEYKNWANRKPKKKAK